MFKRKTPPESDYCIIRQESPSLLFNNVIYRGPFEGVSSALLALGDSLFYGPLFRDRNPSCTRSQGKTICTDRTTYSIEFIRVHEF